MNNITPLSSVKKKSKSKTCLDILRKTISALLLVGILGVTIYYYYGSEVLVPSLDAQKPSSKILPNGDIEVTLKSNQAGHYIFIGNINNTPVKFFYDTGATHIAIPEAVANHLSLAKGEQYLSKTANGSAISFKTTLNSVEVGDISLPLVDAAIATGLNGDEILLGMSFLKHVTIEQGNGVLKLRYTPNKTRHLK